MHGHAEFDTELGL